MYEGAISMKSMHGHGRFQWADGTVYLVTYFVKLCKTKPLKWNSLDQV